MNGYHFILMCCTVAVLYAGTPEYLWLRDLDNYSNKLQLDSDLAEQLQFLFYREEKWIYLYLEKNPHTRADTNMYVVQSLTDGSGNAVNETFTEKIESKYYHDMENRSYFTVRCVKREGLLCARTLEGILRIEDKDFQITPVSDVEYMTPDASDTLHILQEYSGYDRKNISSDEDVELNDYYETALIQVNDRTMQINNFSPGSTIKAGFCCQQDETTFTILADGISAAECNHLTVKVFVDDSDSASAKLCTNSELNNFTSPSARCFNLEMKGDNAVYGGHITITAADDIVFSGASITAG